MRREILFRGKRKDNGDWVYGDLITKPIHHECVILENGCINHSVLPETVGQDTGLKDRNGKDIYEGDIVSIDRRGVYEAGTGVFQWREWQTEDETLPRRGGWMKVKAGWHLTTKCPQIWTPDSIEIIGNIHEHPNLITVPATGNG